VLTRLVILDGIHLKQCVTLYLFSLPFTMVKDLGWATVPIVTLVSFTFMGIEGIAEQIDLAQALMKLISH
jgi:putative membrane protein